jgi:hypothetical protein
LGVAKGGEHALGALIEGVDGVIGNRDVWRLDAEVVEDNHPREGSLPLEYAALLSGRLGTVLRDACLSLPSTFSCIEVPAGSGHCRAFRSLPSIQVTETPRSITLSLSRLLPPNLKHPARFARSSVPTIWHFQLICTCLVQIVVLTSCEKMWMVWILVATEPHVTRNATSSNTCCSLHNAFIIQTRQSKDSSQDLTS